MSAPLTAPNKIFDECKWTPGKKMWLYFGFMSKIAYLYMRPTFFFRWPALFGDPWLPLLPQPPKWRCLNRLWCEMARGLDQWRSRATITDSERQ